MNGEVFVSYIFIYNYIGVGKISKMPLGQRMVKFLWEGKNCNFSNSGIFYIHEVLHMPTSHFPSLAHENFQVPIISLFPLKGTIQQFYFNQVPPWTQYPPNPSRATVVPLPLGTCQFTFDTTFTHVYSFPLNRKNFPGTWVHIQNPMTLILEGLRYYRLNSTIPR